MSVHAEFLFDFGSPNAYLSHKVLPQIEQRSGVRFEYVPILLGGLFKLTNNRSPAEAFGDIPTKLAYERRELRRFVERHGLSRFRSNPFFPVNTLKIMRGACAARKLGVFEPYVDTVYAAMWEDGKNMSEDAVILDVLNTAGFDGAALMTTSQDADVKAQLMANTQRACERGAFGSPSFFVGDELFFGKDRLRDVEEEIVRQEKA
jgi:2-hydroxychromene-2-carboxylate isomerase